MNIYIWIYLCPICVIHFFIIIFIFIIISHIISLKQTHSIFFNSKVQPHCVALFLLNFLSISQSNVVTKKRTLAQLEKKNGPFPQQSKRIKHGKEVTYHFPLYCGIRKVPRRIFPRRSFPRRTVLKGEFPERTIPRHAAPRMTFPRTDISPNEHFPESCILF